MSDCLLSRINFISYWITKNNIFCEKVEKVILWILHDSYHMCNYHIKGNKSIVTYIIDLNLHDIISQNRVRPNLIFKLVLNRFYNVLFIIYV